MPAGLIIGAIYFGLFCTALGVLSYDSRYPPATATGLAIVVLALTIAGGLLLRRRWARWAGMLATLPLIFFSLLAVLQRGVLPDYIVLAVSLITLAVLAIPATGDPGPRPEPDRHAAAGRALGLLALLGLAGFAGASVWSVVQPRSGAALPPGLRSVSWADFGSGLETARQSGKPMFVDFYAEWCGPCKRMDRETFRHPAVLEALEQTVPVRIDAEEREERSGYRGIELALRYQVDNYPTVALIDGDGKLIARRIGFQNARQFLRWLESAMAEAGPDS